MTESLLFTAVGITFCFAFVNGFHDGGNVIATTICSRSMRPLKALVWAAAAELAGALLLGSAVAHTMAAGILRPDTMEKLPPHLVHIIVIAGVAGAILWKIPSWLIALPSSGSHALVGGLVGAGLLAMGEQGVELRIVAKAVVLPMFISPVAGFVVGAMIFGLIRVLCARAHRVVGHFFAAVQTPTMIALAAGQGSNDAQKSMGVIAVVLAAGSGELHGALPIPDWVVVGSGACLAMGLVCGGWRIARTVGFGICRLEPVHSFASHVSATSVILIASLLGGPVSTTQVVSSSVMGVGAARRLSAVRWTAAASIAYAWLLTVPVSACLGAAVFWCLKEALTD